MKAFIDTNILIDVLAKRQPFYEDAAAVWSLAERRLIDGVVSAISFTNIYYIVRKLTDADRARRALAHLRNAFATVTCDGRIIAQAIESEIKDFEDAVQYYSALQAGADCLLSRNPRDFPRTGDCPVLTPTEFLAAHEFE